MTPHDIIDAYVMDVIRHLPRRERQDIGLELRGLLREMISTRAADDGQLPDSAQTIAMLREFGLPEEAAARYREPVPPLVPGYQTGNFALLAIGGVLLQWILSLPAALENEALGQWWFGTGLGALWWPGFMALAAIAAAWLKQRGLYRKTWRPRQSDTDGINRRNFQIGLAAFAIGTAIIAGFPFIASVLPEPARGFFVLDADFLIYRAPLASLLWLGQFILLYTVYSADRWSKSLRRMDLACDLSWIALLAWWLGGGPIFIEPGIDAFVKSILGLLIIIVALSTAVKLHRWRQRNTLLGHPT